MRRIDRAQTDTRHARRVRRIRRLGLTVAVVASCVLGGRAIAAAGATSLGGLSSDPLVAFAGASAAGAPALATCDNFDLTAGDLAGRTVSDAARCNGLVWTVHAGTWTVSGGRVSATGATPAVATLATALSSATVWIEFDGADIGVHETGVVLDHDGVDTYLAAVVVGDVVPRVDLRLVDGGVATVLASSPITVGSSVVVALTRDGTTATVHVAGALVVSQVLDGAAVATLGAATGAGLLASNSSVTADDLRVSPPATP